MLARVWGLDIGDLRIKLVELCINEFLHLVSLLCSHVAYWSLVEVHLVQLSWWKWW